jgi:uncharacterized RDD family membrane protein YckC
MSYSGFWARTLAALIDTALLSAIVVPLLVKVYGWEFFHPDHATTLFHGPDDIFIQYVLPAAIILLFWDLWLATPGKMLVRAQIVDAKTGDPATTWQLLLRYFGYFVSTIPLGLGFLWIAIDSRKQGWHDKIAGTVVQRY